MKNKLYENDPPPLVQPLPWIHEYFEEIKAFDSMLHAFGISNLKKKPDATCLSCDHDILSRVHWCIYQTKYFIQLYSLTILYTNSLFYFLQFISRNSVGSR